MKSVIVYYMNTDNILYYIIYIYIRYLKCGEFCMTEL
jgi:hypothetical protein